MKSTPVENYLTDYEGGNITIRVINIIEEARIGGPQKRIIAVGKTLGRSGVETIILTTPNSYEEFQNLANIANLKFSTINITRLRNQVALMPRYFMTFLADVLKYRRYFKQTKPSLIHTNGASQWKPAIAAKLLGIPVLWQLNDARCSRAILCGFRVIAYFCASGFIVSSENTRALYLPGYQSKPVMLARPPVELAVFQPNRNTTPNNPIILTTVGNLNPDKDILTFIKLAQSAHVHHGGSVVFKVAGRRLETQEAYNAQIDAQLAKAPANIEFLGFHDDIKGLLANTDIFVCTSRSEAGPMSVFEAFAAGLPVVTTDVGDIKALSKIHGEIAAIAPVGDVGQLLSLINSIIAQDHFKLLGNAGREFASRHLDVAQCADAHSQIYTLLAKGVID